MQIVLGKFKAKQIVCRSALCTFTGNRFFASQEEKRTDVNIAVHMLNDAYTDACDTLVIVSGDSDLVPANGSMSATNTAGAVAIASDPLCFQMKSIAGSP